MRAYLPRRPARHEEREFRGLRHRITRWGPASDSPIVLLHGHMDCAETFQFLVDELPADWAFAAPDWRGFGGTQWQADGYFFPDYLADLEAFLDFLSPRAPARVIGHSMGGNVAMLYAGVRPGRLAWLADLEGFGLPRMSPEHAPARYARWLDQQREPLRVSRYGSPSDLAAALRRRNARLTEERALFVARAWTRQMEGSFELTADPRHRRVNPVLYRREEVEACWRLSVIPVLMLLGARSEYLPGLGADGAEAMFRSLIARLQLVTLPDVGHMMHHEDPAAVAREIASFAART